MSSGEKEALQPRLDISACLEAVHMYNAAYHLLREHYDPRYEPPTLVRVAAPPSDLQRAAGHGQETPPEQLVRAAEKSQ